jgi:hypothetical protein
MEVYQRKWSRREEADFFRTVSTYGVEFDRWVVCVLHNKLLGSDTWILISLELSVLLFL